MTKPDRASKNRSSDSGGQRASPRTAPSRELRLMRSSGPPGDDKKPIVYRVQAIGKLPPRPMSFCSQSRSPFSKIQADHLAVFRGPFACGQVGKDPHAQRIKLKSFRHPWQVKCPFTAQIPAVKTGGDRQGPVPPKLTQILPSGATRTLSASSPTATDFPAASVRVSNRCNSPSSPVET